MLQAAGILAKTLDLVPDKSASDPAAVQNVLERLRRERVAAEQLHHRLDSLLRLRLAVLRSWCTRGVSNYTQTVPANGRRTNASDGRDTGGVGPPAERCAFGLAVRCGLYEL